MRKSGEKEDADNGNANLQDSELTADSLENEQEVSAGRGWLGGMGSDFMNIAHCLTENVTPVVSGVASMVHKTAVAVANEIAQLERDGELEAAAIERSKKEIVLDR